MTDETIDIHGELQALCDALGLGEEYESIKEIVFRPGDVRVTLFARNERGKLTVADGEAQTEQRSFRVLT